MAKTHPRYTSSAASPLKPQGEAAEAEASEAAGTTDAGVDPNAEPEKPSRLKEAKSALDQAYEGVAELDAIAAREDEGEDKDLERAQPVVTAARIAFNQGLVAMADARWSDAQVEFFRVLRLTPDDADARWNLEYAWHQRIHLAISEMTTTSQMIRWPTPSRIKKSSQKTASCAQNADWYTVEAERDAILFITIEGEIDTSDAENRTINLALYGPNSSRPMRSNGQGWCAVVGYSGLRQSGVYRFGLSGQGQAGFKYSVRVEAVPPCQPMIGGD